MDKGLLHRADCHASGAVARTAWVAIKDLEPFGLCQHCVTKHAPELFRIGAIVERIGGSNDDCDSKVVKA